MGAPLFGYGLQSFSELNLHHLGGPLEATGFWYINSAHNKILGILIEGGWPYLGLLVLTVAVMGSNMLRYRRIERDDPLMRAIPLGLLLLLSCSMVDIALDVPALAALAVFLFAMMWGRSLRIAADVQRSLSAGSAAAAAVKAG